MATGFYEIQFPTAISYGSIGGPEFSTEIIRLSNGHEVRNVNWSYPLENWDVAYGVKSRNDLLTLLDFFYVVRGRAYGFRFKNHDDYSVTGQTLGSGDSDETEFQLIKTYTYGGETFDRKITKPVSGTVDVFLDSVQQSESEVSIDTTTGIITFSSAPSSGEVVTATFEFDIPARFDVDFLPMTLESYEARSTAIPVVEIRV